MIPLETGKNGCTSVLAGELAAGTLQSAPSVADERGGVGKPGGFPNTFNDPRAGGSVVLPGGFTNTSSLEEHPLDPSGEVAGHLGDHAHSEEPGEDAVSYIPRVWSPGPYSRGGRPTVLTPVVKEELCKLLSIGLSRRQAVAWLHIDHSVISRLAAKDQDFAASIERAEELAAVQPRMVLAAAARKSWRAAAWMLQHPARREPARLTEEEKQRKLEEQLADRRRQLEFRRREAILEEESKEAEREWKREQEEARERFFLAKERAEREERRKRKAQRQAQQQNEQPGELPGDTPGERPA